MVIGSKAKAKPAVAANYCRKFVQLHLIAVKLEGYRADLMFERDFIRNFFNPRIEKALITYRDHITKMQQTSIEDYEFILDRTKRFYDRKFIRLAAEHQGAITSFITSHSDKQSAVNAAIKEAHALIASLNKRMRQQESEFNATIESTKPLLPKRLQETRDQCRASMEKSRADLEQRDRKLTQDSRTRCSKLHQEHKLAKEQLQTQTSPSASAVLKPLTIRIAALSKANVEA
jgi:hypothetical protein